ncbi:MAG: hypothetical protein K6U03_03095 [Firmicutes bacterium]|nr:hypothetical protein [Bacillota bacterium]
MAIIARGDKERDYSPARNRASGRPGGRGAGSGTGSTKRHRVYERSDFASRVIEELGHEIVKRGEKDRQWGETLLFDPCHRRRRAGRDAVSFSRFG